jgi:hypothetical protein
VAGCYEHSDEPSGFGATELVTGKITYCLDSWHFTDGTGKLYCH